MKLIRFGFLAAFAILCVWGFQVNAQPWLILSNIVSERIITPVFAWIPGLGGYILWLFKTQDGIHFLATLLFAFIQGIQLLYWAQAFLINRRSPRHGWWALFGYLVGMAYLLELSVSFITYTPYRGGWDAFYSDVLSGLFDPEYVEPLTVIGFVASAVWTELLAWTGLILYRVLSVAIASRREGYRG